MALDQGTSLGPLLPCSRTIALWANHGSPATPAGVVLLHLLQKPVPTAFPPKLPSNALPASLLPPLGALTPHLSAEGD